jgi:GNAT superfamily N-acetyltransferase
MKLAREYLQNGHGEFDALMHRYYSTTIAHQDVPPLSFDWRLYRGFEDSGCLALYTARDTQLDGFAMYVIAQHPKYPSMLLASADTLAVRPEARGQGLGRRLVEYAADELRALGCTHMTHNYRMIYDTVPLFEKLGFKLYEKVYMKDLI